MVRQLSIATLALTFMLAWSVSVQAQFPAGSSPNPLFSQYVTQGAGTASAALYPAPHYSPMLGAQSNYTYQPLMPHEMMYQHSRNYYNYYNTGGFYGCSNNAVNKTSVRWQAGNNHMGPLPYAAGISGIGYRFNSRRYCLGDECGGRARRFGHGGLGCASGNCQSASTGCSTCGN